MNRVFCVGCFVFISILTNLAVAQQPAAKANVSRGDEMLTRYFAAETTKIQDTCLANIESLAESLQRVK